MRGEGGTSTRRGEEGAGQFVVCCDVFDVLDDVHQPAHHWGDPPVPKNPSVGTGGNDEKTVGGNNGERVLRHYCFSARRLLDLN